MLRDVTGEGGEAISEITVWEDITTVKVPPRTHRRTVVERALAQVNLAPEVGGEPLLVRALDVDSAHARTVEAEQPPPQLRIA